MSVKEQFRAACAGFRKEPRDSESTKLLIVQFERLDDSVSRLALFSDNDRLKEISTLYLPYLSIPYYLGALYAQLFEAQDLDQKEKNLKVALAKLARFVATLDSLGVLSPEQSKLVRSFEKTYSPTPAELVRPPLREEKIAQFRAEKELEQRTQLVEEILARADDEDDLHDDETVRGVLIDNLKLHALYAFKEMTLVAMELEVLKRRGDPAITPQRVQIAATGAEKPLQLVKDGKVLRPFVITDKRTQLRNQVFGTGQVLPSMSVEEYLDYELANGKMLKPEQPQDSESEDELQQRLWDDWKDDNPKGLGNTMGNIG